MADARAGSGNLVLHKFAVMHLGQSDGPLRTRTDAHGGFDPLSSNSFPWGHLLDLKRQNPLPLLPDSESGT